MYIRSAHDQNKKGSYKCVCTGGVGEGGKVVDGYSLCVSDLGGLRLDGEDVFIERDGLAGEQLIEVMAGLRVGGANIDIV